MSNKDLPLLLLTLGETESPVRGRKRLQKTVCLLKYRYKIPFSYDFKPYYYGPYSDHLAESLESIKASGLVEEQEEFLASGVRRYNYSLTKAGKILCEQLIKQTGLGSECSKIIEKAQRDIEKMTTDELVRASKELLPK